MSKLLFKRCKLLHPRLFIMQKYFASSDARMGFKDMLCYFTFGCRDNLTSHTFVWLYITKQSYWLITFRKKRCTYQFMSTQSFQIVQLLLTISAISTNYKEKKL